MNDQQFHEHMMAYLDGTLDDVQKRQFEEELSKDPLRKLEFEREQNFEGLVRKHIETHEAPYALRESIIEQIEEKPRLSLESIFDFLGRVPRFAVITALIFVLSTGIFLRIGSPFPVFAASIDRHMDCLRGAYPMEIESSSPQEVTQWFKDKLSFVVHVPDMSKSGVQLLGARLCHLKSERVALLTYQKQEKRITVFVMDMNGIDIPKAKKMKKNSQTLYVASNKGYQSILCLDERVEGVGCLFVSEIAEEELINMVS